MVHTRAQGTHSTRIPCTLFTQGIDGERVYAFPNPLLSASSRARGYLAMVARSNGRLTNTRGPGVVGHGDVWAPVNKLLIL